MAGKRSFIHQANKRRGRGSDAEKLDVIQTHLTLQNIHSIREKELYDSRFGTKNNLRVPDLSIQYKGKLILIELDGPVHGSLEFQTEKTKRRNADYNRAGLIYILLNEEQCKAENMDLSDLASYRVREIMCKVDSLE